MINDNYNTHKLCMALSPENALAAIQVIRFPSSLLRNNIKVKNTAHYARLA